MSLRGEFTQEGDDEMIPKDYKYITKTRQGWQILSIWQDRFGYLNVVGYRSEVNDYFYARGYDPTTGRWAGGGSYMWKSLAEAEKEMLETGHDGPYTKFDAHDPMDTKFEYDAQYNWNHVDTDWLKTQDHRDPWFNMRSISHSGFKYQKDGSYFEDGKVYEDSEDGYEEFKRDYRKMNSPQRSYGMKGGKYAQRRAKAAFWRR